MNPPPPPPPPGDEEEYHPASFPPPSVGGSSSSSSSSSATTTTTQPRLRLDKAPWKTDLSQRGLVGRPSATSTPTNTLRKSTTPAVQVEEIDGVEVDEDDDEEPLPETAVLNEQQPDDQGGRLVYQDLLMMAREKSSTAPNPPFLPPPHESVVPLAVLESAPPSGNVNNNNTAAFLSPSSTFSDSWWGSNRMSAAAALTSIPSSSSSSFQEAASAAYSAFLPTTAPGAAATTSSSWADPSAWNPAALVDAVTQASAAALSTTSAPTRTTTLPPPPKSIGSSSLLASSSSSLSNTTAKKTMVPFLPPPPNLSQRQPPRGKNSSVAASSSSSSSPTFPSQTMAALPGSQTTTPPRPTMATLPPPPPPPRSSSLSTVSATVATLTPTRQPEENRRMTPRNDDDDDDDDVDDTTIKLDLTKPPEPLPLLTFAMMPPTSSMASSSTGTAAHSSSSPTSSASSTYPILARRQTHWPILVIATERAHLTAWKNQLRLVDLLQGLVQTTTATGSATPGSTATGLPSPGATGGNNNNSIPPVPAFRSLGHNKVLNMTWNDVHVWFVESVAQPVPDAVAHDLLQQHAVVLERDGNLAQELALLEDQVDHLLEGGGGGGVDDPQKDDDDEKFSMNYSQERQRQMEQETKDAFALTSPLSLPWLWRYRQALDAATDGNPHDLLSCPAVVLLVCTTQDSQVGSGSVVDTLRSLQLPHYLPPAYHNGLYDPQAVRQEVLVLHDQVDGPKDWDEAALKRSLKQNFGPLATVLRINSISLATAVKLAAEETTDLWNGQGQKGNCLSVSDRVVVRNYLAHLITGALLPAMEKRIADLNAVVSDRKKGVKNVLKSLWRAGGGKTGDEDEPPTMTATGEIRYRYDRVESQARLLADTLFLVKDYDNALSMYRLIKDDFKHDKAHTHYGGVQEMMALCLYLTDPYGRAKEIFTHIENALLSYSRAGEEERPSAYLEKPGRATLAPPATRLASRLCLVLIALRNVCTGRHVEVADLLASASSHETALGAAVLLEQSSAHYFRAHMYRKYAFHMLMSGHMFRAAEQEHHAFRCFTSALHLYRGGKWDELHNHVLSALAAQLFAMGRMAVALQLYAKLLGTSKGSRVSVKSQQKFMAHLLEICNEHTKKALAGADRMAAPSHLSGAERDAVRQERLDRLVQVVRYTKSASRVLELPNLCVPHVIDSTVTVLAEEASHHRQDNLPNLGKALPGSQEVWDELVLETIAELRAMDASRNSNLDDEVVSKALARIENAEIRRVLAQIDKERSNRAVAERSKRSAHYKETPPVRARMEPFAVEFTMVNPLGIPVDMESLQLVARMTELDGRKICTNEDAVKITPLASYNEKRKWKFLSSEVEFEVPDFCRVSVGGEDSSRERWKSAEEKDPFFVVTKHSVVIDPESEISVVLDICPLIEGDLEIIGLRFRLFDDVWVFHPFRIKGPLLQNTRANRANRVRGESVMLKAKVEGGMPCLTAELIDASTIPAEDQGPTLHGQVGSWVLRLVNVGTAPATNVYLKTNVPWIDISRSEPNDAEEKGSLSCLVGPTGTLIAVPLVGNELKQTGTINPGEKLDVQLRIRTSGAGQSAFYMLFRYEMDDSTFTSTRNRHRWLKKMFNVPVYPSLSISALSQPSFASKAEHILSVDIMNCRNDRPDALQLVLEKMILASRFYQLEALSASSFGDADAEIGWSERRTLHFRVIPKDSNSPHLLSQISFADQTTDPASTSLLQFMCMERAHSEFESTKHEHALALARAAASHGPEKVQPRSIAQIRRANTQISDGPELLLEDGDGKGPGGTESTPHPTSTERLCPATLSDSIHLLCTWKSWDGTISGIHHIHAVPVRPTDISSTAGCPISITARHPFEVLNNFFNGPALVPIEVTLRNHLVTTDPVKVEVSVDQPENFDFSGPGRFQTSLKGGEELCFPLQALIPSAGVYNVQKIRLSLNQTEELSNFEYQFPYQWTVVVSSLVG